MNTEKIKTLYNALCLSQDDERHCIIVLKDDAPEWCLDFIMEIHGCYLPNDWIYQAIYTLLPDVIELAEADEDMETIVEATASRHELVYYDDEMEWLASCPMARTAIDYVIDEGYTFKSLSDLIQAAYHQTITNIVEKIIYINDDEKIAA